MNRFDFIKPFKVWLLIAMATMVLACCAKSAVPTPTQAPQPKLCKRVVVLPFIDLARSYGPDASVWGPITRQVFITDEIAPKGEIFMTKTLRRLLLSMPEIEWLSHKGGDLDYLHESARRMELIRSLQRVGRQHRADGILISYLYAFRDRQGGALGVESPAYVAFETVLVAADTGRLLWQRKFSETQEPLSQNLFKLGKFIQRKGRWVTAREMATQALKDMLNTYPRPPSNPKTE